MWLRTHFIYPLHLQLIMKIDSDIQAQMLDKSQPPKNTSDSIILLGNQTSKPADTGPHPDPEVSPRRANTELNNLPRKDQREYLGERIFPYIKIKFGQIAPKIAGMILSLPQK